MDEYDRGAVAGRQIPAGQANAVACRKGDALVRQPKRRLIDGCTRLSEQVDREQRRKDDEEADQHRSNHCKAAIRPSAPTAPAAVYTPTTADAGEKIEHSGEDQQVAAGDQAGAEREHSKQKRDSSHGRTGKPMAYRADRKSGQRDDDQQPMSSSEHSDGDEERREGNEERLEGCCASQASVGRPRRYVPPPADAGGVAGHSATPTAAIGRARSARRVGTARARRASTVDPPRIARSGLPGTNGL